jgi:hypothetical protein
VSLDHQGTATHGAISRRCDDAGQRLDETQPVGVRRCETAAVDCTGERAQGREPLPALSEVGAPGGGMASIRRRPEPFLRKTASAGGGSRPYSADSRHAALISGPEVERGPKAP